MQDTTVARSYAEALLELAVADGKVELFDRELQVIADLLRSEDDFRLFLETPKIDPADKKRVIREVFAGKVPDRLLHFLLIVIDKRRARLLTSIADEFSGLVDEHFGRLKVDITTASEPDSALQADLKQRLSSLLGKEVIPRFRVDARLIGGVIVRVGDSIMDGSIRHRLQLLRRSLLRTELG
jgi:F-type H+-transporting ATPase subunit delta